MSHPGFLRTMGGRLRVTVLLTNMMLAAPLAAAGPQLWLYPQDAGPREGGHIVPPGTFTLVVENRAKDSAENVAHSVELVVAVGDPASLTALSLSRVADGEPLDLGDWTYGTPTLPCSEKPMPRHGIYPTNYATVVLGDLSGGGLIEIEVTIEGADDLQAHFDAMATASRMTGNGLKCSDVSNPPGHDVSVGRRPGGGPDDCGRVRISKIADHKHVEVYDVVLFTIDVLNDGSCDLTDPVLRDFIPVVDDGDVGHVPAFSMTTADPPPNSYDDLLLEWTLASPLPVGEGDSVLLEVEFDEPLADGQRVVNRVCLSAAELRKPRCAAAVVIVGNPYGDDGPAGPGYWCHAARFLLQDRRNAPVDAADFEDWLFQIGEGSDVFHEVDAGELYDASTIELAGDLLCTPQSAEGAADRLLRHLLTLWLNVVSGRLATDQELAELCDGDELMPADVDPDTVMELIAAVEEALLLPAEDQVLNYWSEVVDAVNNALVPGEPGCISTMTTSGRQRAGHGNAAGKLNDAGIGD